MILGEDAIIISKDEAVLILSALEIFKFRWTREDFKKLQEIGAFDIVDKLRSAVR